MRAFQVIAGLIGLLIVTTQTFRHAYVLWLEPRASVLEQFREETEKDIAASKSLEELVALYEKARQKVKEAEQKEDDKDKGKWWRQDQEPYKSEARLKKAIETWEGYRQQLTELHFFWWCGFASAALGLVFYLWVHPWLGMAGLVAGFSEMLWWTLPAFRALGGELEFDRLLTNKLIYSTATWILLLALWCFLGLRKAPAAQGSRIEN